MIEQTYHLTGYCCPLCGTAFELPDWTNGPAPDHSPILLCPECGGPALRAGADERAAIAEYLKRKKQVQQIIAERTAENISRRNRT